MIAGQQKSTDRDIGLWRVDPGSLGVNVPMLSRAIADAVGRETRSARDMHGYLEAILAKQPCPTIIGPLRNSAGASGTVIYGGNLIAEWGNPDELEMSFSMSKSYLSVVAGIAFDQRLFEDLDEPIFIRIEESVARLSAYGR